MTYLTGLAMSDAIKQNGALQSSSLDSPQDGDGSIDIGAKDLSAALGELTQMNTLTLNLNTNKS